MDNVCSNDDVDERVGAEEWMEDEWEGDEELQERERETDPVNYDPRDWDGPEGEEVFRIPSPRRTRYGFDLVDGPCSRVVRTAVKPMGCGPTLVLNVTVQSYHYWRKHLYKRLKDGRLVCRRCGELWTDIPF